MSFLRRLFGQGGPPPDPDSLRDSLLAAGDERQLEALCRRHRELIGSHFRTWLKVPDEVRARPEALQAYVQGMIAVAQCFAGRLGDGSLLQAMAGPPGSNPVERWQQVLQEA